MYGQPNMYPPPSYGPQQGFGAPSPNFYPQQGPMVINLAGQNNTGQGILCPVCAHETGNIPRKTVGAVTIFWCLFLGFLTGILCCLPFCVDNWKDTELLCVKCQTVKMKVHANCC